MVPSNALPSGEAQRRRQSDPHRTRILAVDDDPSILELMAQILAVDYDVVQASTGLKALALAWQQPVELIVLDMMLPGMSGVEVIAALKDDDSTAHVPILLVTASITGAADGLAAGGSAYLCKPFDLPELLAAVARLLAKKEDTP